MRLCRSRREHLHLGAARHAWSAKWQPSEALSKAICTDTAPCAEFTGLSMQALGRPETGLNCSRSSRAASAGAYIDRLSNRLCNERLSLHWISRLNYMRDMTNNWRRTTFATGRTSITGHVPASALAAHRQPPLPRRCNPWTPDCSTNAAGACATQGKGERGRNISPMGP